MLRQVIRAGDQVVFARAHEHPKGDTRSFLVEEVVPGNGVPGSGPHARLVPIVPRTGERTNEQWLLKPVEAIKHDPESYFREDIQFSDVNVAPRFLGNPDQWCWWEREYPDEGAIGGYQSRELAMRGIQMAEDENKGKIHFHVSELVDEPHDAHYLHKHPQLRAALAANDARKLGRSIWTYKTPNQKKRGFDTLAALSSSDARRFFTVNFVMHQAQEGDARSLEERTVHLRITLIGKDPFQGFTHCIVVERQNTDLAGEPSWVPMPQGSRIHEIAIYWLLRRMIGIADRHKPLALIGTIHEKPGVLDMEYTFTPSEEQ